MIFRKRKINFMNEQLVVCKVAILIESEIPDEVSTFAKAFWLTFPETRILIKKDDGFYYEPNGYSDRKYQKGCESLKNGSKFVEKECNLIQEIDSIPWSEKEWRTKKISIKRIREVEKLLNSNEI